MGKWTSGIMREQASHMQKRRRAVEHLNPSQIRVDAVIEGTFCKFSMCGIILVNAIQVIYESDIGAACDFDKNQNACDQESGWLKMMNWLYLLIYSIELGFRVYVHRVGCFTQAWDMFDAVIILTGVMSEALGGYLPSPGILRLARLARLIRAVRIIRLPPELHVMIHGFVSALKAISTGAFMIFLMLVFWAVVAVLLLNGPNHDQELLEWYAEQGCSHCPRAWSSVAHAVFSWTQLMLMGESWDLLAIPLIQKYPGALLLYILVYFTVVLGMANLILAVIVNKALATHDDDLRVEALLKDKERQTAIDQFTHVCQEMDVDGDGTISLQELKQGFANYRQFRDLLDVMDINQDELDTLFALINKTPSLTISYVEFAKELVSIQKASLHTLMSFTKYHVVQSRLMLERVAAGVLSAEDIRSLILNTTMFLTDSVHIKMEDIVLPEAIKCVEDVAGLAAESNLVAVAVPIERGKVLASSVVSKPSAMNIESDQKEVGSLPQLEAITVEDLLRLLTEVHDQAQTVANSAQHGAALAEALRMGASSKQCDDPLLSMLMLSSEVDFDEDPDTSSRQGKRFVVV